MLRYFFFNFKQKFYNYQFFPQIYDRLQPAGVCLSYQGTINMMREMGNHFSTQLRKASETKKRIRIVRDNVNFAVGQADLRKHMHL
jgi:hypothetical protein